MMKRFAIILAILIVSSAPAHANPGPMMSDYLRYVAMPAFLLWCLLGVALIGTGRKLRLIGVGTSVFAALAFFLGLYEFVLIFWQIYLGLIVARLVCQRRGKRDPDWLFNLIFHGTFLAAMIAAGVQNKIAFWSGRWPGLHYLMEESFPATFIIFLFIGLIVFVFSHSREWGLRATESLKAKSSVKTPRTQFDPTPGVKSTPSTRSQWQSRP